MRSFRVLVPLVDHTHVDAQVGNRLEKIVRAASVGGCPRFGMNTTWRRFLAAIMTAARFCSRADSRPGVHCRSVVAARDSRRVVLSCAGDQRRAIRADGGRMSRWATVEGKPSRMQFSNVATKFISLTDVSMGKGPPAGARFIANMRETGMSAGYSPARARRRRRPTLTCLTPLEASACPNVVLPAP